MNVIDIINEINNTYPDIDKNQKANNTLIKQTEDYIKKPLPESYKKFVKYFSNGIFLLDIEPICGVGRDINAVPSGMIELSNIIVPHDSNCYIVPEKRFVDRSNLICFTAGSAMDTSLDHWVFIADDEAINSEYKVGYVAQTTGRIVSRLDNFEKWLNIFWDNNKIVDKDAKSVFYSLHPDFDNRIGVLDA